MHKIGRKRGNKVEELIKLCITNYKRTLSLFITFYLLYHRILGKKEEEPSDRMTGEEMRETSKATFITS